MTTLPPNYYPTPHQPPYYAQSTHSISDSKQYDDPVDSRAMQYPGMVASSSSGSVRLDSSATALQMGYGGGGITTSLAEGASGPSFGVPPPSSAPMQQHTDGWWSGSGDSGNGSGSESTTPPSAPFPVEQGHQQSIASQYHLPNNGDIFTPNHFVTPSSSQQNGFSSNGSGPSFTRPQLTSSNSFPGSLFTSGEPLPNLVTPPSAGYPVTSMPNHPMNGQSYSTPGLIHNYHFGMPPPPPPHIVPGSAGHPMAQTRGLQMSFRQAPSGFNNPPMGMGMGNDEWAGEWEDDEHPGEWYTGGMEVSLRSKSFNNQRVIKPKQPYTLLFPPALPSIQSLLPSPFTQSQPNIPITPLWFSSDGAIKAIPSVRTGVKRGNISMDLATDDEEEQDSKPIYKIKSDGTKVKHRRRTSPEQLKVLEHWFGINPKPDNALREWLAGELGMTKRNVQVWFQNRRAKIKGQQIKEKVAQEKAIKDSEGQKTPPGQITSSRPAPLIAPLPHPFPRELRERAEMESQLQAQGIPLQSSRNLTIPLPGPIPNGGRRVSLANGEAERIQMWAAKRVNNGAASSPRSPTIGQAAAARRGSIPYPTPLSASFADGRSGGVSPKFSPSVRPMPSTLHLTAIRNNTRRASMPGPPQLISSGPFTPPRIVSANYPMLSNAMSNTTGNSGNTGRQTRELSPIKDTDAESGANSNASGQPFTFSESDFSTTYLTPPSSTYNPSGTSPNSSMSTTKSGELQTPHNGPLPNPSYSFGANPMFMSGQQTEEEAKRTQAIYMSMQDRGRLGSLASVNTWTTEGTSGTVDETELADIGFGFDQSRRASAPAELLENLGHLGLGSFGANGIPLRPSPLGMGNTSFTTSEPLMQPPYVQSSQFSSHQPGQLRIPSVPEHMTTSPTSSHVPSPSDFLNPGSHFQASPIEMNGSGGISASSMSAQSSMHSNAGSGSRHSISPAQTPFSQISSHSGYAQTNQYLSQSQSQPITTRSLSAGIPDWSSANIFGNDDNDDMLDFSFAVPTMSVSAPASAYPGSQGESQSQQVLLAPANIPGSKGSSPRSSSGGSQIGVGKGMVRTDIQMVLGEAQ